MKKITIIGLAGVVVVAAMTLGYLLGQRGREKAMSGRDAIQIGVRPAGGGKVQHRRTPPKPGMGNVPSAKTSGNEGDVAVSVDELDTIQTRDGDGPAPVRGDIRDFVMEEYVRLSQSDGATDAQFLERIRTCGDRAVLATLLDMVRNGSTSEEKLSGLFALAAAFGRGNQADDDGGMEIALTENGEPAEASEEDARRVHDVVSVVEAGLADSDKTVRRGAYEAVRDLRYEEQGILKSQIMTGEDSELKRQLIADTSGSINERDILTSISALENSDAATARAAADNLKSLLGQQFTTQDEALAWWEKNSGPFLSKH